MRRIPLLSTWNRSGFAARGGFLSSVIGVELAIVLLVLMALGASLVAGAAPRSAAASQQASKSRPIRGVAVAGADERHVVVLTDACCFVRDLDRSETYPLWMRVESERATAVAGSSADHHVLICRDHRRMDLFNAESGESVWRTTLPRGDGLAAAFSPDGSMIAVATDQREVLIVESQSARVVRTIKAEEPVHSVCFTPCGRRLVVPVTRREIGVWDLDRGCEIVRFPIPDGAATSLAMHPSGDSIAVATYEGLSLLMSLTDGQVKRKWSVSILPVLDVAFRPDGQEIFTASCDGEVCVFSPEHDAAIRQFTAHQDAVRRIAFTGERLVTGGYDGIVRSWDPSTARGIALDL